MRPRKHLFKKIELRARHPRRIALEFLVQLFGLREHKLIDLTVKLREELQGRRIEDDRASNSLSERRMRFSRLYPRHGHMRLCADQKSKLSLSETPAAT